eukprot:402597-Karenia_brevis.AAC.1
MLVCKNMLLDFTFCHTCNLDAVDIEEGGGGGRKCWLSVQALVDALRDRIVRQLIPHRCLWCYS